MSANVPSQSTIRPRVPIDGIHCGGAPRESTVGAMNQELDDARKELDKEFEHVRKNIDELRTEMDTISAAGPEDDISQMLHDFEEMVKKVRTGGLIGSGAKGHRDAREDYLKLRGVQP